MNTFNIPKTKYLLICALAFIYLNACKSETKQNSVRETNNVTEKAVKNSSSKKPVSEKIPLNKQELEDTFPFRIGNFERDFLEVSGDMATSKGAFGNGKIHLKIADAAGPLGTSLITMFNAIYESKKEKASTVIWQNKLRNNIKTLNRYETDTQNASIEFIYIERFHILLTGKKLTPDELWNLFEYDNYISSLQVLDDFDNKSIDRNH